MEKVLDVYKKPYDEDYPVICMDESPKQTFEPEEAKRLWDRFEFVLTPKYGSWLNMAEIGLR